MSLAGLRCAETLRRLGFGGTIHAVGEEHHEPYDRPPLSKEMLSGAAEPEPTRLNRDGLDGLGLELHLGSRAVTLIARDRRVELDDGRTIGADVVVIATGARPRRLPPAVCPPDLPNVHVLRTLDDAVALERAIAAAEAATAEPSNRIAIVGAGFIGMEVAAACRGRGVGVTVVEALEQPMIRGLGPKLGATCAQLHREHGVRLELGRGVERVDAAGLVLADGHRVDASAVLVGVGAAPATEWLDGSGLELADGVVCDAALRAAPGIYAIGDVARWPNPLFDGASMRLEHWTNAAEQAMHVGASIANAADSDFVSVPFVWSDQYDCKIQAIGRFDADCDMHVAHGTLAERRFVALFGRAGRLVGALGFSQPRLVMQYRRLVADRASWDDALAMARGDRRA